MLAQETFSNVYFWVLEYHRRCSLSDFLWLTSQWSMTRRKLTCDASINPLHIDPLQSISTHFNIDPLQTPANLPKQSCSAGMRQGRGDGRLLRRQKRAVRLRAKHKKLQELRALQRGEVKVRASAKGAFCRRTLPRKSDCAVILSKTDAMVCGIPPEC